MAKGKEYSTQTQCITTFSIRELFFWDNPEVSGEGLSSQESRNRLWMFERTHIPWKTKLDKALKQEKMPVLTEVIQYVNKPCVHMMIQWGKQ